MEFKYPVTMLEGRYEPSEFYEAVKGLENVPEGGERCFICYEMRMREAAEYARKTGADYFTTTLSCLLYTSILRDWRTKDSLTILKNELKPLMLMHLP